MWLSPAVRERGFAMMGAFRPQVETSMASLLAQDYNILKGFSSEHSLLLQMRLKHLSPDVQRDLGLHNQCFGTQETSELPRIRHPWHGLSMSQCHRWDCPLSLLAPAPHPTHSK